LNIQVTANDIAISTEFLALLKFGTLAKEGN